MLLEFKQVTTIRRGFSLNNISFQLPQGYIMGLMGKGKNGAGKTTLLTHIVEERIRYHGEITLLGKSIRKYPLWAKSQIAFITEEGPFFEEKSLEKNAELFGLFYESFSMEGFRQQMKKMELPLSRIYGRLSRGERIRFHLAFAMAYRPCLYLMDEVTAGMDPVFRTDFYHTLHELIRTGENSVIMTGHLTEEMEQRTDYLGILSEGRLAAFGETPEVMKLWPSVHNDVS